MWKSSILEALSLPSCPLVESKPEYLLKKWEDIYYLGFHMSSWNLSCSFDKEGNKKKYLLWEKNTTKANLKPDTDNYNVI